MHPTSPADLLIAARRGQPLPEAPTLQDPAEAYAVQRAVGRALGWFGDATPQHWKSGGPSRTEPLTHAPLPPAGVWASPAAAGDVHFTLRGIEAEVALRLREPVDAVRAATIDSAGARALVDAMCVSIEVVDSRWQEGLAAPALARLADLSCHGALALGEWVPFDATRDWAAQTGEVRIGTQPVHHFGGTHTLGDPAWLLPAWLRHATQHGQRLAAGSVVTTGSWCGLLYAAAGDEVTVHFDGIGSASLQL